MIAAPAQAGPAEGDAADDATQAPDPHAADQPRGRSASASGGARGIVAVIAFVVLGVIVIVLLAPAAKSNTYLDPAGSDVTGTKALVAILGERGFRVTSVYSPADALDGIGASPRSRRPAVTLVI